MFSMNFITRTLGKMMSCIIVWYVLKVLKKIPSCKVIIKRFTMTSSTLASSVKESLTKIDMQLWWNISNRCTMLEITRYNCRECFSMNIALIEQFIPLQVSYFCVHCGMSHNLQSSLRNHVRRMGPHHSKKCVQCDATFEAFIDHETHVKKEHEGIWKFICGLCDKVFDTKKKRNRHRNMDHESRYS